MEEPRFEDIGKLVDELEEEYGTLGPIPRKVRVCPKCGKHNLENVWHCIDCGTTLSMKALMDMESSQPSGLSSISPYFEQDVAETLDTVIQDDESVIWGCNISFGYLLVTSQRLIGVWFTPEEVRRANEVRRAKAKIDLLLGVLANLVLLLLALILRDGSFPDLSFGGAPRDAAPTVDCPSRPLTQKELASRRVAVYDLEKLVSADLLPRWQGEVHPTNLTARFREDKESTFAFCTPHEAREAHRLIAAWLDT